MDAEGDRRTHRGEKGGSERMFGLFNMGSGERQVFVFPWISQVFSLILLLSFII